VRHLSIASYAITVIGIFLVLLALIMDLAPWAVLAGVLLAWAGIVKIAVVVIWTKVAGMETDQHKPIDDV
jgi:hypothetical protein